LPFIGAPEAAGGPTGAVFALPEALGHVNMHALIIAAVSLAIMVFWPRRLAALLPAPLAALVVGTLLSLSVLTGAPVIGDVPTGLPPLHMPSVTWQTLSQVIQPAFVLALLGTIDSLLTSLVADSITRSHHNSNRELIGQGIGNMAAGLLGALPGAGATMRTVVNVRAGGRTPVSGALHALILLSLVLGLAPLAEVIPHAVLAGILIKVGWDIIDWSYLKRIRHAPRDKVVVMFITLTLTVFVDLITAVAVGLIAAGFVTARWMEREEMKGITTKALADEDELEGLDEASRSLLDSMGKEVATVSLRGSFSYASARALTRELGAESGEYRVILLDFSNAAFIDTSAAMAIDELLLGLYEQDIVAVMSGLSGDAQRTLSTLGVAGRLPKANQVATLGKAIERAAELLG
ncbi:MAG TPA: SulP family inorganic anion transporter, partial [Aliiroseovarius sp.]|nr:SulP family inorganic anion transporter [Aliiroseovarius sp.]